MVIKFRNTCLKKKRASFQDVKKSSVTLASTFPLFLSRNSYKTYGRPRKSPRGSLKYARTQRREHRRQILALFVSMRMNLWGFGVFNSGLKADAKNRWASSPNTKHFAKISSAVALSSRRLRHHCFPSFSSRHYLCVASGQEPYSRCISRISGEKLQF